MDDDKEPKNAPQGLKNGRNSQYAASSRPTPARLSPSTSPRQPTCFATSNSVALHLPRRLAACYSLFPRPPGTPPHSRAPVAPADRSRLHLLHSPRRLRLLMQKPQVKKMMRRIDGSRTGASDHVYRVFLQDEALHANDIPGNINIDEEFVRNFDTLDGFGVEESILMNEIRSQEPKSDSDYEGDHEDSDFFIDEDNIIEDVEVDMEDFYMNIDTGAETNELSSEAEDLEVIDNDEFDSLSDDSRDTRRRELLKELGKQKVCSKATFLSKQIIDQIEMNPEVPVRALQDQLVKKYDVHISEDKVFRAKAAATKVVEGDYTKQYAILRDYVLELQITNPGTTVKIEVVSEPNPYSLTRQFKRIYVCLGALKKGFKAVVESENTSSWKWFLECLGEDLELYSNSNFTFVTDRQKGLDRAIGDLFPHTEHMYCVRHIYQNMRREWKATEYKDFLWKCAKATIIPEFEAIMNDLSIFDKEAYKWLLKIALHHWARSHFSGPLTPTGNRLLEANSSLASQYRATWNGGQKYQVEGFQNDQHVVDMGKGCYSGQPDRLDLILTKFYGNIATKSTYGIRYGVHLWTNSYGIRYGVHLWKWELTGIPCKHAIATLYEMAKYGEHVGELYTYVHKVYWLDTWKEMYSFMWPKSDCPITLLPPPHHITPCRPKKKRKITADEKSQRKREKSQGESSSYSLSMNFLKITCGKCKKTGHNARTCTDRGGN
ncbi:hypothetical protein LXL04_005502 [Taraxacum kok-saghyz]